MGYWMHVSRPRWQLYLYLYCIVSLLLVISLEARGVSIATGWNHWSHGHTMAGMAYIITLDGTEVTVFLSIFSTSSFNTSGSTSINTGEAGSTDFFPNLIGTP